MCLLRLSETLIILSVLTSCTFAGDAAIQPPKTLRSPTTESGARLFETRIRPILADHCYQCHGPNSGNGKANLRIDSIDALLKGGVSGPALIPGEPEHSLLIIAVRHEGGVAMPPKSMLAKTEIDALSEWVKLGAPWSSAIKVPATVLKGTPPNQWGESARQFWAFQMPRRPTPPAVDDERWPISPIDRFILASLESKGLHPAPPSDKRTLLRRVTLDLLGIPPSIEETDAFLADESAGAFERVLDRLLCSPHYGERWGRHWLDVVRYADSNGMDDNLVYSDAWRFRDYVINSLNSDKPFSQFLEEQLAGDLIAESEPHRRAELNIATGFLSIGPKMLAEDDPVKQQMDIVDEQLDTTCRVFLGLTMGCARCHDHKFDPLSMSDYYAMAGIFQSTQTMLSHRVDSKWNTTALGGSRTALRLEDLEQIIDRHDNALVNGNPNRMSSEERTAHSTLLEEARKEYATIPKSMAVTEGHVRDLEIFLRGNHLTRSTLVPRRLPTILAGAAQPAISLKQSGRLEVARWMTGTRNPLTARVIVNRIWRWHFGQGLVRTVDNLGQLGERPSHPELLDWLAIRLINDGWSLKSLHKRILSSRTYQMNSNWNEQAAKIDPDNRLLWRTSRRRLEAEEIRDAILFVSGELNPSMGGTLLEVSPFQDLSLTGLARSPVVYQSSRRSTYLPVFRSAVYDVFQVFDFPDPAVPSGDRATTTVASQALFMMNSQIVKQASEHLSTTLLGESARSDQERLRLASLRILGRKATTDELSDWESFLKRYQAARSLYDETPERRRVRAWQGLCRTLLSSNEFVYVD